jgi:hypothetical protein
MEQYRSAQTTCLMPRHCLKYSEPDGVALPLGPRALSQSQVGPSGRLAGPDQEHPGGRGEGRAGIFEPAAGWRAQGDQPSLPSATPSRGRGGPPHSLRRLHRQREAAHDPRDGGMRRTGGSAGVRGAPAALPVLSRTVRHGTRCHFNSRQVTGPQSHSSSKYLITCALLQPLTCHIWSPRGKIATARSAPSYNSTTAPRADPVRTKLSPPTFFPNSPLITGSPCALSFNASRI